MDSRCLVALCLVAAVPRPSGADEASAAGQTPLPVALVEALNKVAGGPHQGFRANHAKGIMASGQFVPSNSARTISRAPHFVGPVSITVRFSNDSGRIDFHDASRDARPHGMAIRFHLSDGSTTDIVTNTTKAFPVSTPEEFLALLNAAIASGPGVAKPTPLDQFIATHPTTLAYFTSFHPPPVSFGTMTYFGLNAFKFTNELGENRFIRYQFRPAAGEQYLSEQAGAQATPNYLMDELPRRLTKEQVKFTLVAQLASAVDNVDDPARPWPASNPVVELGTISLDRFIADPQANRAILFNPVSLPPGIEPSADPVLAMRFPAYAVSFRQRAEAAAESQAAPSAMKPLNSTESLAKSNNCLVCHAITTKVVGPAYRAIAAKYAGQADAEDILAQKIQKGGSGVWGQTPMPPNAQLTEAEARSLVKWVLQQ